MPSREKYDIFVVQGLPKHGSHWNRYAAAATCIRGGRKLFAFCFGSWLPLKQKLAAADKFALTHEAVDDVQKLLEEEDEPAAVPHERQSTAKACGCGSEYGSSLFSLLYFLLFVLFSILFFLLFALC